MIAVTFRPLSEWPGPRTPEHQRQNPPFSAKYSDTLVRLDRELVALDAHDVMLEVDAAESMIRADGYLKERARIDDPGVILSFDSRHGPLRYACDTFDSGSRYRGSGYSSQHLPGWQQNLRAIALGLEALRKVDRYGITAKGEQYKGFRQLGSGAIELAAPTMTVDAAAKYLAEAAGMRDPRRLLDDPMARETAYKAAAKLHHPDVGGNPDVFRRIALARKVLAA